MIKFGSSKHIISPRSQPRSSSSEVAVVDDAHTNSTSSDVSISDALISMSWDATSGGTHMYIHIVRLMCAISSAHEFIALISSRVNNTFKTVCTSCEYLYGACIHVTLYLVSSVTGTYMWEMIYDDIIDRYLPNAGRGGGVLRVVIITDGYDTHSPPPFNGIQGRQCKSRTHSLLRWSFDNVRCASLDSYGRGRAHLCVRHVCIDRYGCADESVDGEGIRHTVEHRGAG